MEVAIVVVPMSSGYPSSGGVMGVFVGNAPCTFYGDGEGFEEDFLS